MSYNIFRHLEYNAWANARIAEAVRQVDEKLLFEERKSSFSSIAKTLTHIMDSEQVWLKRLQGISLKQFPSVGLTIAKDELIDRFEKGSKELLAFVQGKGDQFIGTTVEYTTLKGQPFSDTVEDILYHVVNHETYHRGQIITMLREAGVETLPATDLIVFLRTKTSRPAIKIEHLALWCSDLEKLKKFYTTYFDARAGEKYFNPKKQFESYFLSFDHGCRLELMQMPGIPDSKNNIYEQFKGLIHFAISVGSKEAVDTLTNRLRGDGYDVVGEPRTTGDGYYESVVLDPEGNRIEITA